MAEHNSKEHIIRLSSVDQAASRVYINYSLCFPCQSSAVGCDALAKRLAANVKRTVTHLPVLAGHLRPTTNSEAQSGSVEVVITLENVLNFETVIKTVKPEDLPKDYHALERARMPPEDFVNVDLSPLADSSTKSAVFAVQANFIQRGLLVTILLHHSVADSIGFMTFLNHLSSDLPSCKFSDEDLEDITTEQSRLRDRLSGSRGVKGECEKEESVLAPTLEALTLHAADLTIRVLSFNVKLLQDNSKELNHHFFNIRHDHQTQVSYFDVLAAILWKGIARARLTQHEDLLDEYSSVVVPLNIRSIAELQLDDSFFGNAEIPALATSKLVRLSMPFQVDTLVWAAKLIHDAFKSVDEKRVRAHIADINECSDMQSAPISKISPSTDVVIASIADMDLEHADLGLGLGGAGWIRKLGATSRNAECLVHPVRTAEGLCEVTVQLVEADMDTLLKDEKFMSYVSHIA